MRCHVLKFALSHAHFVHDCAHAIFWNIQIKPVNWFTLHAIDDFYQNFWLTDLKFIAISSHVFNQNGKVHFATTANFKFFCSVAIFNLKRKVFDRFFIKSVSQVSGRHKLSFSASKRAVVDHESHFHTRFCNFDKFNWLNSVFVTNCVADCHIFKPSNADNFAKGSLFNRHSLQAFIDIQADNLRFNLFRFVVKVANHHILTDFDFALVNLSNGEFSDIIVVFR